MDEAIAVGLGGLRFGRRCFSGPAARGIKFRGERALFGLRPSLGGSNVVISGPRSSTQGR